MQDFNISDQERLAILKNMHSLTSDATMRRTSNDAFEAMKMLQSISKEQTPNRGEQSPAQNPFL